MKVLEDDIAMGEKTQTQIDFVRKMIKNTEAFTFFISIFYSAFWITGFRPSDLASCFSNDNWLQNEALYVAAMEGRLY